SLGPKRPWAHLNRARLYQALGNWDLALEDYNLALESGRGADRIRALHERGLSRQSLGDLDGARADYEAVVGLAAGAPFPKGARVGQALPEGRAVESGLARLRLRGG